MSTYYVREGSIIRKMDDTPREVERYDLDALRAKILSLNSVIAEFDTKVAAAKQEKISEKTDLEEQLAVLEAIV